MELKLSFEEYEFFKKNDSRLYKRYGGNDFQVVSICKKGDVESYGKTI